MGIAPQGFRYFNANRLLQQRNVDHLKTDGILKQTANARSPESQCDESFYGQMVTVE